MIQLRTENGLSNVTLYGDAKEIAADALIAIKSIYDGIKKNLPAYEAEYFKDFFIHCINDPKLSLFSIDESGIQEPVSQERTENVKSVEIRFPWQKDNG